jgi:biotin carboxyl carrier protein
MPGLVVKVEVEEGDLVEAGTGLLIVEAMKMENELSAEVPARVGVIHVSAGQAVEKGQLLMDMLPPDAGDGEDSEGTP